MISRLWRHRDLRRTVWALSDQAVVSMGVFLGQILLARTLPQTEYGTFALLFGVVLTLQLVTASLLFYPLAVRLVVVRRDDRDRLLGASLVLIGLLTLVLALLLAGGLAAVGRASLIGSSLGWFLLWQTQEAMRRGLLSELRPGEAIPGDAVTYLGQAALMVILALAGGLTLTRAMYAMAAMSLLGALVHARRLQPRFGKKLELRATLRDYVSIGAVQALTNGMLATLRIQVLPWVLAVGSGPAATAALQAANNIINASNPVMIGLGNVIPQAASQSSDQGLSHAWWTVLKYALMATPFIGVYSVAVLAVPGLVLRFLYGASSDYTGLSLAVRLLMLANVVGIATEFVVWYLHGVRAVPRAVGINMVGALASLVLTVPLVALHGLTGGCVAMIGANGARLLLAHRMVSAMTHGRPT